MSRKRVPRAKTRENSLRQLTQLISINGSDSYLSRYDTIARSNNASLISLNRIILTYFYTGIGVFQTAIQLPIQDAIRKGVEIESGELSNDDIDTIYEYWEEEGIWTTILNTWTWVRLFGGGGLLINSVQDPETPLSYRGLYKTPLEFYDLDRWQLDTNIAVFDDWDSYVSAGTNDGIIYLYGEPIHESRILRGQGKRAPHYIRRQLRGWGMSEGERMIRDIQLYLKTQDVTFEILDEAKLDIYKIQGLANKLLTTGGTSQIQQRVESANILKNYLNALVLDGNEEYEQKTIAFSGLAEVMQQNRIGVASALRMPVTKLFGLSVSGFNTGESDLENYNAMVESEVRAPLNTVVRKLLKVTMAHLFGYIPTFQFQWPSLRELSAQEEQQVRDSESNRVLALYDRGLMDSKETMQSLRKAGVVDIETKAERGLLPEQPAPPAEPNNGAAFEPKAVTNTKKTKKERWLNKIFNFKEEEHNRDESGKFTTKGDGESGKKKESNPLKALGLNKREQNIVQMSVDQKLPENVFVHGRSDRSSEEGLDTGFVKQGTKSFDVAESYGGESIWIFEVPENTPSASNIADEVYERLKEDERKSGEMDELLEAYEGLEGIESFKEEFDPENIVDTAGLWDNIDFMGWFYDNFPEYPAVHVGDEGIVVIDESEIDHYGIDRDKYDEGVELLD